MPPVRPVPARMRGGRRSSWCRSGRTGARPSRREHVRLCRSGHGDPQGTGEPPPAASVRRRSLGGLSMVGEMSGRMRTAHTKGSARLWARAMAIVCGCACMRERVHECVRVRVHECVRVRVRERVCVCACETAADGTPWASGRGRAAAGDTRACERAVWNAHGGLSQPFPAAAIDRKRDRACLTGKGKREWSARGGAAAASSRPVVAIASAG